MTRNVKICISLLLLLLLSFTVAIAALADPEEEDPGAENSETTSAEESSGESDTSSEASSEESPGESSTPVQSFTVTIVGEHVEVIFAGELNSKTSFEVKAGGSVSFRVIADPGYQVDSVTHKGNPIPGSGGVYTISSVNEDYEVVIRTSRLGGESSDEPQPPESSDPSSSEPTESSEQPVQMEDVSITIHGVGSISANGQTVSSAGDSTVTGTIQVESGVPTQFKLSPAYGYRLTGLKLDGTDRTLSESFTLTIDETTTLEITFEPDELAPATYQVVISCTTPGGYLTANGQTITSGNAVTVNVNAGSSLTINVFPADGYEVDAFLVGGAAQNLSDGVFVLENIAANTSISASFKEVTTTITPAEAGDFNWKADANRLIQLDLQGKKYIGKSVFDKINTLTSSDGDFVVLVTQYVRWYIPCGGRIEGVPEEYLQLTVQTGANGSFYETIKTSIYQVDANTQFTYYELSADLLLPAGTKVSFYMLDYATAYVGSEVSLYVVVSDPANPSKKEFPQISTGSIGSDGWTTRMDYRNSRNLALLIRQKFTIDASAGENGKIDPAGKNNVDPKTDFSFTVTADDGYVISVLYVDDIPVGEAAGKSTYDYRFTDVKDNHTIRAEFRATDEPIQEEKRSYAGLIVALVIAFVAVGGAAALFVVKWRQEKF